VATYQNLLDGALNLVGRLGPGETASSAENTDYLIILNELIEEWTVELGPVFSETLDSLTWTGGQASRTIGTGGDFNVARPQKLISAQFRQSANIDLTLKIISHTEYQREVVKTLSVQYPQYIAYNPTFASSLGTLFIWPIPPADATIRLNSLKPLASVSALSNTVTLPPGYQKLTRYGLTKEAARLNGRPDLLGDYSTYYTDLKAAIISGNMTSEEMQLDPLAPGASNRYDDSNVRLYTSDP